MIIPNRPYSVKKDSKTHITIPGVLIVSRTRYNVLYDDTVIIRDIRNKNEAYNCITLMNAAYRAGFYDALARTQSVD